MCRGREAKNKVTNQIANFREGEYVLVFPLVVNQARTMKGYDHIPRCGLYEKTCLLEKESTVNGNADRICRGGKEGMGDGNSWSGVTDPMDPSPSGTGTKCPLLA
jgi:hypothetical protein